MNIETVLAPVDDSEAAMEAMEYAVAIADRYDAKIHALYVFGEAVVRGVAVGDLTEAEAVAQSESAMASVRALAGDVPVTHSSAYGFSLSRLSQHPGSVILDAAEAVDADFVVIPREPVTGDPSAVIEKAAEYVLAHASQPVLSV
ncbi:universal stress protein [Natronomonas sp. EA1]|uniref:universal stress protein n=1 Tax=Natronomonas sp. EA1 TaxID=3421655 RepID=UPI003EB7D240